MINVLKKIFPPHRTFPQAVGTGHKVTKQERVIALLKQAHQDQLLLSIRLPGQEDFFSTALLGVYAKQGFLVLDELKPKEGHDLLLEQKTTQISGQLDGVTLAFKSRLIEAREKAGIAFYKMEIPDSLYFRQRRQLHRVSLTGKQAPFRAHYNRDARQILLGYIFDLSAGGVGVILEEGFTLHRGDILPACTVRLPGEGNIIFSLEVCYLRPNPERNVLRMGGRFLDLDGTSRRRIRRAINRLERAQAKRIRKT